MMPGDDDLTPAWFAARLPGVPPGAVTSVTIEPLGGLATLVRRVHLRYRGDVPQGPASVVVKLPLAAERGQEATVVTGFRREVQFYRTIAPRLGAIVPRAYWADGGDESDAGALVLEDLPAARAWTVDTDAATSDAGSIVIALAQLHTRWWNSAELGGFAFLRTHEAFIDRVEAALPASLPRFLARFGAALGPPDRAFVESLPSTFRSIAARLGDAPPTLVHHDLSLRNVLLDGAPGRPVVFIDWQLAQRSAAVRDLSYFAGTSVPPEREAVLVRRYGEMLRVAGIADYPQARIEQDYRRSIVCDLARMVMTGGADDLAPAMARIVAGQLAHRRGATVRFALDRLT